MATTAAANLTSAVGAARPTGYDEAERRFRARQESGGGQGSDEIEQGSAQAEEGEGEDHRSQPVAEGRSARAGASEERLMQVSRRNVSRRRIVHDGTAIFFGIPMQTENIIERAFQLARGSSSV